jgi:alpha-tubulin suppressor-like RCC1 family protein
MLKRFLSLLLPLMLLVSGLIASQQAANGSTFEASGSLNVSNRLLFEPIVQSSKSPNSISLSFTNPREVGILDARQLTIGFAHTCALLNDKSIKCWGYGGSGQLGNGSIENAITSVSVLGISTATQVTSGGYHTCALLEDKSIKCWGGGGSGQLGNGSIENAITPVSVLGISTATQVTAGEYHTCALLEDKSIKCWGHGGDGRLGNGSIENAITPVSVSGISTATQVSAGHLHTCALLEDKSIKCWGYGNHGQLGNDSFTPRYTPDNVFGISTATHLDAGGLHTCAVLEDTSIMCWGMDHKGQIGTQFGRQNEMTPAKVFGISDAVKVTAGKSHTCAQISDGSVRCWGSNDHGQLGVGSRNSSDTPVYVSAISNAAQIVAGEMNTCALVDVVKCWGSNNYGNLGVNENVQLLSRDSPVDVFGDLVSVEKYRAEWSPDGSSWQSLETGSTNVVITGLNAATTYQVRVSAYTGSGWSQPSPTTNMRTSNVPNAPSDLTQSSIKPSSVDLTWSASEADDLSVDNYKVEWSLDGLSWQSLETTVTSATITGLSGGTSYKVRVSAYSVAGWGEASSVIDVVTTARPSAPVGVFQTAKNASSAEFQILMSGDIVGMKSATQLDASTSSHTCALMEDKTIGCWSSIGTIPVSVSGITSAIQISQGAGHTCALLEDKSLKCWGENSANQLGNATGEFSHIPVAVQGIMNATQVAAGSSHTCALLEDKTIKCWGFGGYGQLGHGSNYDSDTPVSVIGISNATQVAAGSTHTCALLEDKTIKCWGRGQSGILGSGSGASSSSPVSVLGIANATQLSVGHESSCALLNDKTIKCWGYGGYGILGNGSTSSRATPVSVWGVANASAITVGLWHACALLGDGTIKCWGRASSGQLGIGQGVSHLSSPSAVVSGITNAVQVAAGSGHTCALTEDKSIKCWGNGIYELPGSGLDIEKWRVEWSSNGTTWQNSEIQDKSALLTQLAGATSYQLRIKSYTQAGYSDFSEVFHVSTSGTRSMRFNFKLSDGRQLTGGAVSWALDDESYASATNYGVPSSGVLDFPRVAAGTGTITVNGLQSPTGESISFTRTIELGQAIHNVTVPVATGKGSYKINVKLPNGEPVLGASISVTGLDSYKAVEEIAYNLPSASSGSTNDQGWFQASGFVTGTPRAKVTYNDGVLVQTKFVDLTSASTNVVLDEMPWLEVNESAQTVSSGALVNVPVSLKGVSSKSGYTLSITAPSGSLQKCKGRVLSAKTNSSGKATLKVCANKSGTYKVKTKGAVSTGVVQLKVKNAAPLPVNAVTARSTSLGSATVAWSAPSYTGGASITGYKVIITGGGKTFTKTTTARTHTFTGLKNATQYTVTVEAITKYGSSSRVTVRVGVA